MEILNAVIGVGINLGHGVLVVGGAVVHTVVTVVTTIVR